jgi:hypothetical protein
MPTASLQTFHGQVVDIANSLLESPSATIRKQDYFRRTLIDPDTGKAPFSQQPFEPAALKAGGLLHRLMNATNAVAFVGFRGVGKSHLIEALREHHHCRDAKIDIGGLVVVVDAKELYQLIGGESSVSAALTRFALFIIEKTLDALIDKTKSRIGGRTHFVLELYKSLLSNQTDKKLSKDDAKIDARVRDRLVEACRTAYAILINGHGPTNGPVDSIALAILRRAGGSIEDDATASTLKEGRTYKKLLEVILSETVTATQIREIILCIDDLSELTPTHRLQIEKFLYSEFITNSVFSGIGVRFRLSFYPTMTFGPRAWNIKFVHPAAVQPWTDTLYEGSDDPLVFAHKRLTKHFLEPLLKARCTAFDLPGTSVFSALFKIDTEAAIEQLSRITGGNGRRLGILLLAASERCFEAASDEARSYSLTADIIHGAAINLFGSLSNGLPGFLTLPEPINTATTGFGAVSDEHGDAICGEVVALWHALSSSDYRDRMMAECGEVANVFASSFAAAPLDENLLAPLINTGHIIKRCTMRANGRTGAAMSIFSLNYGFVATEQLHWDLQIEPSRATDVGKFCTASAGIVSELCQPLARRLVSAKYL